MAFTKKTAQENRQTTQYAKQIVEVGYRQFHQMSHNEQRELIVGLAARMQEKFPDIREYRLRNRIFAAIRRRHGTGT